MKRFNIYKRNKKGFLNELLTPVIIVLIGLGMAEIQFFNDSPIREYSVDIFPTPQEIVMNKDLFVAQPKKTKRFVTPEDVFNALDQKEMYEVIEWADLSEAKSQEDKLELLDDLVLQNSYKTPSKYSYGSFMIHTMDTLNNEYKVATFVNTTSQDATGIYPGFLYEAVLRVALDEPDFKFKIKSHPHPIPEVLRDREGAFDAISLSFMIAIAFAMVPSSVISYLLSEKATGLKHQQLISGMSIYAYWTANYIFEIFKMELPVVICLGLVYAFGQDQPMIWRVFLMLPVGLVPFTFGTSFFFQKEN